MTLEIKTNNDNSITIKELNFEQLQVFNNIFGDPTNNADKLVNPRNQQCQQTPITINGNSYAYSVYDAKNYGKDTYTIGIQKLRD